MTERFLQLTLTLQYFLGKEWSTTSLLQEEEFLIIRLFHIDWLQNPAILQ